VFTGVSGSGKSSLVFDTIAAESQRMINETYSAFVQGFMPTLARPEVDLLDGLTTAIIVDQERMGANPRSTVGTATDANAMLRILFSRLGEPHIGSPNAYSFNVPSVTAAGDHRRAGREDEDREGDLHRHRRHVPALRGHGLGLRHRPDRSSTTTPSRSTRARSPSPATAWTAGTAASSRRGFFDPDKPIASSPSELHDLLYKEPTKIKVEGINLTYEGLIPKIQKSILSKDVDAMQPHIRAFVERAVTFTTCPDCDGTRLSEEARSSKIAGSTSPTPARCRSATWPSGSAASTSRRWRRCWRLQHLLDSFVEIGLGYLSLDRPSGTLSGGEAQRTKMIRHLGSSLTDVTYVFDEPTIGLHPHDIQRMNDLLLRLRDKGNTVLVVEHKPETIAIADHVVDLGPGAGTAGGEVVLRGHRRGAAGQRHPHRPPPRRPGRAQGARCGRPPARWRSAARRPTTCRTSTSTSRSACWSWSPAWPGRARAR
jgi:excinuclease UvrABC ATPase subunit